MNLRVSPRQVSVALALAVGCLVCAHVFTQYMKFEEHYETQLGFERLFNLDYEGNIPTWYASVTLLLSAFLLAMIGIDQRKQRKPFATHWAVLAGIFMCLSVDEAAGIHEMGIDLFASFHLTGYLTYSWVLLGGPFALFVGLSYLRFLAHLPAVTKRLFLLAGSLYVGGALGVEMISAQWYSVHGQANFTYAMIVAAEETLEMAGIAVFIYALCSYIEQGMKEIRLVFGSTNF